MEIRQGNKQKSGKEKGKEQKSAKEIGKYLNVVKTANIKVKAKSESTNRYAILDLILEEINSGYFDHMELIKEDMVVETRKARAVSYGIADLMKTLKPRKQGLIDKGKKAKASSTTSGGQSLPPSL